MFEDPLSIALIAIAGVLIVFMFISSRRRRRDAEAQREKIVPGVEVMTSQGIYGTLLSIDTDKNEAIIETTPGTRLRLGRRRFTVAGGAVVGKAGGGGSKVLRSGFPTSPGHGGRAAGCRSSAGVPALGPARLTVVALSLRDW